MLKSFGAISTTYLKTMVEARVTVEDRLEMQNVIVYDDLDILEICLNMEHDEISSEDNNNKIMVVERE